MKNCYCKTRYPIMLVHGLGVRDESRLYWGRIPKTLQEYGAQVYFGEQDAWGSIEGNAAQLRERIAQVRLETGCEKVNLIAHSKGGLEARYLISTLHEGAHIASLSMMSTPNRGSTLARHIVQVKPIIFVWKHHTNWYWSHHGDHSPDFDSVARQLTPEFMEQFNRENPNDSQVYYQSWATELAHARSDRTMALTGALSHAWQPENDGLVAPESARWGKFRGVLRGVSHQEVVDHYQRDLPYFSVRKLYVSLAHELGQLGF